MAGLGLGLGISSGTVSSGDAVTPTPGRTTNFGRLVAQDDDFILKDLNILAEELVNEKTSQMQKFALENKNDICLKIENQKYQDIVDLLLQFILLKEPQEHYKKQITKIKDIIKNNK